MATAESPSPRALQAGLLVAFATFVVLGLPDGVIGTIWPTLRDDLGRTQGSFGWIMVAISVGYTTASFGSGRVTARIGVGRMVQRSIATSAAGLAIVATSPGWWVTVAGFLVLGVGNGGIDAGLNAWVALTRGPRAMGMLHAAFGLGATLGPLLAALFVRSGGWRGAFIVIVAFETLVFVGVGLLRAGFDATPRSAEVQATPPAGVGSDRLLALMIGWFCVYVAVEVTVGQWSYTLLTEGRDVDESIASLAVAAYWGGLTVGRLLLGGFGHRARPEAVVSATTASALVAIAWLWIDPGGVGAWALPVVGLSLAVMFPMLVNRTPVYLGAEHSNHAVGYQLAASSVGFVVVPSAVGLLADRRGIEVTGPVAFGTAVALALLWLAILSEVRAARG